MTLCGTGIGKLTDSALITRMGLGTVAQRLTRRQLDLNDMKILHVPTCVSDARSIVLSTVLMATNDPEPQNVFCFHGRKDPEAPKVLYVPVFEGPTIDLEAPRVSCLHVGLVVATDSDAEK